MSRTDYINHLPQTLITEIFTHLPAKSLGLCKCVSKPWNTLISDPHFVKTHASKTSNNANLIIISSDHILHSFEFRNKPTFEGYASRFNFDFSKIWKRIWGSCNGLVLVEDFHGSKFLINPTILELKKLPLMGPGNFYSRVTFGFGYDISCDEYVVVIISYQYNLKKNACVYVYMLRRNLWKTVGFSPYDHDVQHTPSAGVFLSGSLHWLAKKFNDSLFFIAAFDIANEIFSEVAMPNILDDFPVVGILKGFLSVVANINTSSTELWVMKEYGVGESWIKLSVVVTENPRLVTLHVPEDNLVKLGFAVLILLAFDVREDTMYTYIEDFNFEDVSRIVMNFSDSLVSPNNKDEKKKIARRIKLCRSGTSNKISNEISGWVKFYVKQVAFLYWEKTESASP